MKLGMRGGALMRQEKYQEAIESLRKQLNTIQL